MKLTVKYTINHPKLLTVCAAPWVLLGRRVPRWVINRFVVIK
jgi:hypothetical protein